MHGINSIVKPHLLTHKYSDFCKSPHFCTDMWRLARAELPNDMVRDTYHGKMASGFGDFQEALRMLAALTNW